MKRLWKYFSTMGGILLVSAAFLTACTFRGCTPGQIGEGDTTTQTGGEDPTASGPTNTDGALTILVPGGTFWMGSEENDALAGDDEKPKHEVTLSEYYIYGDEVTNAMYAECIAAEVCTPVAAFDSGPISRVDDPEYGDHPVVGVDWNMANTYCTWANAHLPTEAQWEFAARGTDSLVYPWGSEAPDCAKANMLDCLTPGDDIDTMPVGQLAGGNSPFGVDDLAGNVWEWVQDWYDVSYYLQSPATNPVGPYSGELKVARGGGWESEGLQLRGAERANSDPSRSYQDVGFRCVASGQELPEGYSTPPDSHTIPGDPNDLGDPDPDEWYKIGPAVVSCPDQNANMHIAVFAVAYQPMDYSLSVNGNPFTCTYNDVIHILSCDGPIPANNDALVSYDIEVVTSTGKVVHLTIARPKNCAGQGPFTWWTGFNCFGDDPSVQINIDAPGVHVTSANVNGVNPLNCIEMDTGVYMCIGVIDGQPGEWKTIHFNLDNGFDGEQPAFLPTCAGDGTQFGYIPTFTCNNSMPAVSLMYTLPGVGITSVDVEGSPLNCGKMGEGIYLCQSNAPLTPGELKTINFCLQNLLCYSGADIVLDCAGNDQFSWLNKFTCNGYDAAVSIWYDMPGVGLVSASVEGSPMNCGKSGEGSYLCGAVPNPVPGELREITFCLENQMCYTGDDLVLDCANTPVGEWVLHEMGCTSPDMIYFIMDTGEDWLVQGAEVMITADDGVTTYACVIDGMTPGRVVCSGMRPAAPDMLKYCMQQPADAAPACTWISNWDWIVAGLPTCDSEPETPPCGESNPQDPNCAEPAPETPACSTYTDAGACGAAGCKWVGGSLAPGYCTNP